MSGLAEAIARLTSELERWAPDFDLGALKPASQEALDSISNELAPLDLPDELAEWWAWCGGTEDVAIPAMNDGEFVGETWMVPAHSAFDLFRSLDQNRVPAGQVAPHRYGPKNLLEIAGVETLSVHAEIVVGSDVCPIWLSEVEDPFAWPAFGSIAEFVGAMASSISVTDPELVEIGWMWCTFMGVPGDTDIAMPAIYVTLHDRNYHRRPEVERQNADRSRRAVAVAWPDGWIERDS